MWNSFRNQAIFTVIKIFQNDGVMIDQYTIVFVIDNNNDLYVQQYNGAREDIPSKHFIDWKTDLHYKKKVLVGVKSARVPFANICLIIDTKNCLWVLNFTDVPRFEFTQSFKQITISITRFDNHHIIDEVGCSYCLFSDLTLIREQILDIEPLRSCADVMFCLME